MALCAVCIGASDDATKPDNYVIRAKQFVRAFYPSLGPKLHAVIRDQGQLNPAGRQGPEVMNVFTFEVDDPENRSNPQSRGGFTAYFAFDWTTEGKELFIMSASGPGADGRQGSFIKEMETHPNWSDKEVVAALTAAGARFGPDRKSEFLSSLPLESLRPYVGSLQVVSVEFYTRASQPTGLRSDLLVCWFVKAKWLGPNGLETSYLLTFEPFEGRIISIFRNPPPHQPAEQPGK